MRLLSIPNPTRLNRLPEWTLRLTCLSYVFFMGSTATCSESIQFNRDIRPILSEHCFACHGPDANHRQADLRFDVAPDLLNDPPSWLVPGDSAASELIRRIHSNDPDSVMPPPETNKPLTEAQQLLLAQWIDQGAPFEGHWAYSTIQRPDPPVVATSRHPIDRFINAIHKQHNLTPTIQADRVTLARRLSFDLHGRPIDPEELHAFVNDPSPEAYVQFVERMLASPRFAEKLTLHWLDAVRYADTAGFHGDQPLDVWPYRDYVLNSFHNNKPFDQFTIEQLAGDLLPNPTEEQLVATGFNRLNRMSSEGGVQDKEYLIKYAADRVRTVSTVWLGSTLGCAECHDHKYDPFTTQDFYAMSAYFSDITEKGFYDGGFDRGDWGPSLQLISQPEQQLLDFLDQEIKSIDLRIQADLLPANQERLETSILDQLSFLESHPSGWKPWLPQSAASSDGAKITVNESGLIVASGPNPVHDTHTLLFQPGPGEWNAIRITTETSEDLPGNRIARGWTSFVISEVELTIGRSGEPNTRIPISGVAVNRDSNRYPGEAAIDGNLQTGWACEFGHSGNHTIILYLDAPLATDDESYVHLSIAQRSEHRQATLGRYRVSASPFWGATLDRQALPQPLIDSLKTDSTTRSEEHHSTIQNFVTRGLQLHSSEAQLRTQRLAEKRTMLGRIPSVLITQATTPRETRILPRGDWMDESGQVVQPSPPTFLKTKPVANQTTIPVSTKIPHSTPRQTRLDLAHWITDPSNPLTARVFVNRLWHQFFGQGLAPELDDLGSQGGWPEHQELLDWLSAEFMSPTHYAKESKGWDIKHIVQLIVTSEAYQRSSIATSNQIEQDPSNRYLTRQVPFRIEAEAVRDTALAAAGILNEEFGGPSIRPFQPSGYWLPLNYPKREYAASLGDDQYRRSLYIHWQRTFLHPALVAFDAASREECQVSRTTSNTPLQSLVLLNDPIFVEAARGLADRAFREQSELGDPSLSSLVNRLFTITLGRHPSDEEKTYLLGLYQENYAEFQNNPASARQFLSIGDFQPKSRIPLPDLAALTTIARVVLNLHETITRP